jgi:hypothetical protein
VDVAEKLDKALRPGTVTAESGGTGVRVEVLDADRLGVLVNGVRVSTTGRSLEAALAAVPSALSTALRRPFQVTEADPALGGAVARTAVEERSFYELRTTGPEATLERWRVREGDREREPWPLTREDLGRVVRALAS